MLCGSGGPLDSHGAGVRLPRLSHRHRYPTIPLLFCQSKARHGGFSKNEKQTTSEVGARVPSLHPATFRMFHTHPVSCSICRCARGPAGVVGEVVVAGGRGSTGLSPPRTARTGKAGVFHCLQCQMRFLHSCLHLTPETNPSNIPRGGQRALATHFMYSPSVPGQCAILYLATTAVF